MEIEIKYKDLSNFILGMIYYLKFNYKPNSEILDLRSLMVGLGYPSTDQDVRDMSDYLESKNFVKSNQTENKIYLEITPAGIVYIQEDKSGILDRLSKHLESVTKFYGLEENKNKLNEKNILEEIIILIDLIIKKLDYTPGEETNQYLLDLIILKAEFQKKNPDFEIITKKLEIISKIESVQDILKEIINKLKS
jgi:uncharacterized protein YozE (UPF0346 family)